MEKIVLNEQMEFKDTFVGKHLIDAPELQLNLICMTPGLAVPPHNANSNVRLLVLFGEITVTLDGETSKLSAHEIGEVKYGTAMQIINVGETNAAFLVIKAPHPDKMP